MKCPTCGSEVPDRYARCADCGAETTQLDHGQIIYCASCGGKRKAKQRAAIKTKAVKPKEDK